MKTTEYFEPGITCIQEVYDKYGEVYDATTLQKIADCPRKYQVRKEMNLEMCGPPSAPMVAGIAIHEGLEYYYSLAVRDSMAEVAAIQIMQDSWASFKIDRAMMNPKFVHLSAEHLTGVVESYFHCWNVERIDIFSPFHVTLDDLHLEDVVAAKFRTTSTGELVLGESNLIMKFDLPDGTFVLSGKPDLPVTKQDNSLWVMDHKTTSKALGDWWAKSYEVSNALRGYMAMLASLLHETPQGAIINGILVGKNALKPTSKALKFERYQFDFSPDHITEALMNQQSWVRTADHYREKGYWPQACGYGGCDMPGLCKRDPAAREVLLQVDYQPSTREFWEL